MPSRINVGGGFSGLIGLPVHVLQPSDIEIRSPGGVSQDDTTAGFYTTLLTDKSLSTGTVAAVIDSANDTTEQTIIDITGQAGILTSVGTPYFGNAAASTCTVRVTVDGTVKTFVRDTFNGSRMHVGLLEFFDIDSTNYPISSGGWGFVQNNLGSDIWLRPSLETVMLNKSGIEFNDSLKVTFQFSNLRGTGQSIEHYKAWAMYLNYKPQGN